MILKCCMLKYPDESVEDSPQKGQSATCTLQCLHITKQHNSTIQSKHPSAAHQYM